MNRRDLLKFSLLAVASTSVARGVQAGVTTKSSVAVMPFSEDQRTLVSLLSEMIIPETDTPGAIEAGVPNFIEVMVGDWYTETERQIFYSGLTKIEELSAERLGLSFLKSSATQQEAILLEIEALAAKYTTPNAAMGALSGKIQDENAPFFTKLKELTVLGYYTSEIGATQELAYNSAPMKFDGDYDFSKIGRQWSH